MKQGMARWSYLSGSDISSWRALKQSLILAGVSPDEPDSNGACPGHIILHRIFDFLLYEECWISWK
jgi:hypothetical protein